MRAVTASVVGAILALAHGAAGQGPVEFSKRSLSIYALISEGNTEELKKLLDKGLNPNEKFEDGSTMLHWVAREWRTPRDKRRAVAELLIERGAAVDARTPDGRNALMSAAQGFSLEVAEVLLEAGVDPNAKDKDGSAAAHYCVNWTQYDFVIGGMEGGCAAVLSKLADHGADLNIRDKAGRTPLMWASGWHHLPSQETLLARGADVGVKDPQGRTALSWCALKGPTSEAVKNLLEAGAKPGFMDALLFEDADQAWKLIEQPDAAKALGPYGETALMRAAEIFAVPIVERLLDKGADVQARDERGFTAMHLAVGALPRPGQMARYWTVSKNTAGRERLIRTLASHGADLNAEVWVDGESPYFKEETPLVWAVQRNLVSVAKALLDGGADPHGRHRKEPYDETVPLVVAAQHGSLELMQMLLKAGADPDQGSPISELHYLPWDSRDFQEPSKEVRAKQVRLLLEAGANPNGSGHYGSLEAAINHENVDALRLLLAARAYPNGFSSSNGETPLMAAARKKSTSMVKLLLDHGADPLVRSPRGFTAGWLARSKGMRELGALLTEAEKKAIAAKAKVKAKAKASKPPPLAERARLAWSFVFGTPARSFSSPSNAAGSPSLHVSVLRQGYVEPRQRLPQRTLPAEALAARGKSPQTVRNPSINLHQTSPRLRLAAPDGGRVEVCPPLAPATAGQQSLLSCIELVRFADSSDVAQGRETQGPARRPSQARARPRSCRCSNLVLPSSGRRSARRTCRAGRTSSCRRC